MILIEWQPFESCVYLRKYSSSFTLTTTTVYVTVIMLTMSTTVYVTLINVRRCTLRSDCQGATLSSLLILTVDTTDCDVVLIACYKTSQFLLCDTGSGDVQKSPIWSLGSIGGDADEVKSALSPALSVQFTVTFTAPLTSPEKATKKRIGTGGGPGGGKGFKHEAEDRN